jgi:TRAP-type mannitol/chloroaromatic compound transport system permease large subunit
LSDITIGLLSFPALLTLIFLRVPIGLAMFVAGLVGMMVVTGDASLPFARLKAETYATFSNYSLSIVPMFLLIGHFATLGGMNLFVINAMDRTQNPDGRDLSGGSLFCGIRSGARGDFGRVPRDHTDADPVVTLN